MHKLLTKPWQAAPLSLQSEAQMADDLPPNQRCGSAMSALSRLCGRVLMPDGHGSVRQACLKSIKLSGVTIMTRELY
ncbi:hypothetical protein BKA67DRAFT_169881 [Truncatella angustata]|uniref:Uncharacterized protein n=1 Tax=Truncatella angustata TaxID=152316 RepID=A0A9P8URA9_9PEZI|nr:uncharacterized protein BKA67DRAFT_169881 [Truncatella angustata]KAH6656813.1 hypothetical protein BKA67DRAFT_169881 [Truncatella angustata]